MNVLVYKYTNFGSYGKIRNFENGQEYVFNFAFASSFPFFVKIVTHI